MDNIVAILDRSGSMSGYTKATIDGYNEFIGKQLKLSPDAVVTLVLFDDEYEVVYKNVDLVDVEDLTDEIYTIGGMTALHDALGKSINEAEAYEARNIVNKTIFAIFTDGYENASKEFTPNLISTKVKGLESDNGWEFIYVGCDHDVLAASASLGMKSINTISMSKSNLKRSLGDDTIRSFASSVAGYRT